MDKDMNVKEGSGQVTLIAVLAMALILLSTEVYIFEVRMQTVEADPNDLSDHVFAVKLKSKNVVIGSLVNVSHGGPSSVLATNLQRCALLVGRENQFGRNVLGYTVEETPPYYSGIWLFWGDNGFGASSACSNLTLKLSEMGEDVNLSFYINITSILSVQSTYKVIQGDEKQVNTTIDLLNEGEPALAEQITLYYRVLDTWLIPNASNNYVVADYGNGTYRASFQASIPSQSVEVSVHIIDKREIYVQANATCGQI